MKVPSVANSAVEIVEFITSSFMNEVDGTDDLMPLPRLGRNRKDNFDSVTSGTTQKMDERNTNSGDFVERLKSAGEITEIPLLQHLNPPPRTVAI